MDGFVPTMLDKKLNIQSLTVEFGDRNTRYISWSGLFESNFQNITTQSWHFSFPGRLDSMGISGRVICSGAVSGDLTFWGAVVVSRCLKSTININHLKSWKTLYMEHILFRFFFHLKFFCVAIRNWLTTSGFRHRDSCLKSMSRSPPTCHSCWLLEVRWAFSLSLGGFGFQRCHEISIYVFKGLGNIANENSWSKIWEILFFLKRSWT